MFASETVYGCDAIGPDEDVHVMSDRVQSVATNIYKEFERMIPSYGEEVVKEMMPHIVNVLESLDLAFKENQEREAELELCKDDNDQLMSQYEREKQLRKNADQKLLAIEDLIEEEKKEMSHKLESYKLTIKGHELKAKNAQDHIARLEEKESELKKDFGKLHDRYNDLLKRHMECVEKSKMSMTESMFDSMPKNFQLPILRSISNMSNKEEMRGEYDPLQHVMRDSEKSDHFHNMREVESMERDVNTDRVPVTEMGTAMSALSPMGGQKNKKKVIKPATNDEDFDDFDDDDEDDLLGQIVNPAEFSSTGMSKEIENLILENTELLATKNALNVVKDDLIARLDETMSEQEILKEELKATQNLRDQLREQVIDLEAELRNYKEALDSERRKSHNEDGHDELSMAQRKRFTRVEMARVLMERNQYKERLMELQEAVRWTEMIRASREHPDLLPGSHHNSRKKSSLWNYFERLFVRRNDPPRRVASLAAVRYNAPTSPRRENLRLRSDISEKRRKTSEDQYKSIKAHVKKDDAGRIHAYGWSLPSSSSSPLAQSAAATPTRTLNHVTSAPTIIQPDSLGTFKVEASRPSESDFGGGGDCVIMSPCPSSGQKGDGSKVGRGMLPVPVPIYCKPLHKADASVKLWCGATAFDDSSPDPQCRVWICHSDAESKSYVSVVDARSPDVLLERFQVSEEHVLCETYVPGACDDFSDEKFSTEGIKSEELQVVDGNEVNNGKVEENDSEDGEIKVYRCNTQFHPEGTSADIQDSVVTLNQPSMWLGSQIGRIYIHPVNNDSKECLASFLLQDSIFAICHLPGRVFLALANGQVIVFCRSMPDGAWNLSQHYSIKLGSSQFSVRCMCVVDDNTIWCACRNKIYVINAANLNIEKSFEAHARVESQIRQMAFSKEGVWVSIRLDSTLRLFDSHTCQHLQDVDVEPYVSKMLGTGKLGFSFIRITCLMAACNRLWIGTGNGVIICVPLLESGRPINSELSAGVYKPYGEASNMGPGGDRSAVATPTVVTRTSLPYYSMAQAQLSFHGYKDAVKFFVWLPEPHSDESSMEAKQDEMIEDGKDLPPLPPPPPSSSSPPSKSPSSSSLPPPPSSSPPPPPSLPSSKPSPSSLVMSGGEGYVDFRMGSTTAGSLGDADEELDPRRRDSSLSRASQSQQEVKNLLSHIIVWHVTPARIPGH